MNQINETLDQPLEIYDNICIPYHPCTYGIFTYIWLTVMLNVGKWVWNPEGRISESCP